MISQRAIDTIVSFEVTSRKVYEAKYQRPEWPGGASGVTVGIGYDLGYASKEKIQQDWGLLLNAQCLGAMYRCAGVHGDAARSLLPQVRGEIFVPWDAAMKVFLERDVPEWEKAVCSHIPKASGLSPDSLGALVSLAYNRGASFDNQGERFSEMRDIKLHVQTDRNPLVPIDFRNMKRLWPSVPGLQRRREIEARLFSDGLSGVSRPAEPMPPPPAGAKEHGSAGGVIVATGSAANDAASAGWASWEIALLVIGGCVLATAIWFAVRAIRKSSPMTARMKDIPS